MIVYDCEVLAFRPLPGFLMGCCLIAMLAACAPEQTLTMQERTRLVAELIAGRSECYGHLQKLSIAAKDQRALRELYEAAKAAHCLKPDV